MEKGPDSDEAHGAVEDHERGDLRGAIRTCIGCRGRDARERLVRVVADAAGRIRIDVCGREPGRGAWLHAERRCVEQALKKDALGRALKRKVVSPATPDGSGEGFWGRIEQAVKERNEATSSAMKGSEVGRA